VARYLEEERAHVAAQREALTEHDPYRKIEA
jgi:predicted N-acyltransferase